MSPHASTDLFVSLVSETVAAQHGGCLKILWPKDSGEVPGLTPPVAHAPVEWWQQLCTRQESGDNKKAQVLTKGCCLTQGSVLGSRHVGTPASVGGQHVVVRPEDEPSCICRSLFQLQLLPPEGSTVTQEQFLEVTRTKSQDGPTLTRVTQIVCVASGGRSGFDMTDEMFQKIRKNRVKGECQGARLGPGCV
jgi:hypothetical protein